MSANWRASTGRIRINFDRTLEVKPSWLGNWDLYVNGKRRQMQNPQANADFVTSPTIGYPGTDPRNFVQYFGVPEDVHGAGGVPVAPFVFTPVTVW